MPGHKNQVKFDPALQPSRFRHREKKQINSDPYAETKSISIPHIEIKLVSTTAKKSKSIWYPHYSEVIFEPHTKKSTLTTTQPPCQISIPTLKSW